MRKLLIATVIVVITVFLHTTLHIQLVSLVMAPLVLAIWVAMLFKSPGWAIFTLIIITELLSQAPPGAMAAALLLPVAAKPALRRVPVGFTISFFGLVVGILAGQLLIVHGASTYASGALTIPWPMGLFTILGSGVAAFLICIVWYELTARSNHN